MSSVVVYVNGERLPRGEVAAGTSAEWWWYGGTAHLVIVHRGSWLRRLLRRSSPAPKVTP